MQMSVACNLIPMGDKLDSDPTVDVLDKDAVGINGLCSLSWCLLKYYHVLFVIARLNLCYNLVNCPAIICLPIIWMFYLITWETPLVNPWPPVHLLTFIATFIHRFSSSLLLWSLFIFSTILVYNYPLCFLRDRKDWQPFRRWGQSIWLSVCRYMSVDFKVLLVR